MKSHRLMLFLNLLIKAFFLNISTEGSALDNQIVPKSTVGIKSFLLKGLSQGNGMIVIIIILFILAAGASVGIYLFLRRRRIRRGESPEYQDTTAFKGNKNNHAFRQSGKREDEIYKSQPIKEDSKKIVHPTRKEGTTKSMSETASRRRCEELQAPLRGGVARSCEVRSKAITRNEAKQTTVARNEAKQSNQKLEESEDDDISILAEKLTKLADEYEETYQKLRQIIANKYKQLQDVSQCINTQTERLKKLTVQGNTDSAQAEDAAVWEVTAERSEALHEAEGCLPVLRQTGEERSNPVERSAHSESTFISTEVENEIETPEHPPKGEEVHRLAEQGIDRAEIARKTELPIGEVDLLLSLGSTKLKRS